MASFLAPRSQPRLMVTPGVANGAGSRKTNRPKTKHHTSSEQAGRKETNISSHCSNQPSCVRLHFVKRMPQKTFKVRSSRVRCLDLIRAKRAPEKSVDGTEQSNRAFRGIFPCTFRTRIQAGRSDIIYRLVRGKASR